MPHRVALARIEFRLNTDYETQKCATAKTVAHWKACSLPYVHPNRALVTEANGWERLAALQWDNTLIRRRRRRLCSVGVADELIAATPENALHFGVLKPSQLPERLDDRRVHDEAPLGMLFGRGVEHREHECLLPAAVELQRLP